MAFLTLHHLNATTTLPAATASTTSFHSPDNQPRKPLSHSAKVGIGVSLAVLVSIGIALALLDALWLRKRKRGTWLETQHGEVDRDDGDGSGRVQDLGKDDGRNGMSLTKRGEEVRREVGVGVSGGGMRGKKGRELRGGAGSG